MSQPIASSRTDVVTQETYRRVARDSRGASYLWIVMHDAEGYHACKWRLSVEDAVVVEAWDRMMSLRRSSGLPELPAPDNLSQPEPEKLTVQNLEDARELFTGEADPALAWHAEEFLHHIDPSRFEGGVGISSRRALRD
jgi:hypothetical protein